MIFTSTENKTNMMIYNYYYRGFINYCYLINLVEYIMILL